MCKDVKNNDEMDSFLKINLKQVDFGWSIIYFVFSKREGENAPFSGWSLLFLSERSGNYTPYFREEMLGLPVCGK